MRDPTRTSADGAERVERDFIDASGTRWSVYEQPYTSYDRRQGLTLIFESEAAVRRVRNYPPEWSALSDEELARLSWSA